LAPRHRLLSVALLLGASALLAERLPWSVYDSSNGLAGDAVRDLLQDSQGYLWIATSSGLSRFDGREFRNYDRREGLPVPRVETLAETPDGSIWAGTALGLARLAPEARRGGDLFVVEDLGPGFGRSAIDKLYVGPSGALWAGVSERLARIFVDLSGAIRVEEIPIPVGAGAVISFAEEADGTLWIGAAFALLRRSPAGVIERLTIGDPPGEVPFPGIENARALAVDAKGRLWGGGNGVLFVWWPGQFGSGIAEPVLSRARIARFGGDLPEAPGEVVVYGEAEGLPSPFVNETVIGRDSTWVVTRKGVLVIGAGGSRTITTEQGLVEALETSAVEDRDGSLWLGSESRGISRLGRSGFVTYDEADGLVGDRVSAVLESPPGRLFAVTWSRDLHRFDQGRFESITPRTGLPANNGGWGWNQTFLWDRKGRLWIPTGRGLFRFAPLDDVDRLRTATPERGWKVGNGLPGNDVFRLFEDRHGDIWVATISFPCLTRFVGGETPVPVPGLAGHESMEGSPTAFAEDRGGNLWVGFYVGHLARYDGESWRFFDERDGMPSGFVGDLHVDREGNLWAATQGGGLVRVERPESESPRFVRYTTREGLTTDSVRCVTEDAVGRILIGTSRGIDRLDPATGGVRSFSTEDGLPNNLVYVCHAASDGALWFGTLHGLARYQPPPEESERPPRVLITGVAVAGEPVALPDRGVETLGELILTPRQRSLRVDFVGVSLALGKDVQYQHRVLGASEEWSAPSPERGVQLAALAAGSYRFEVRAVTRAGGLGANVAALELRVLPPLWRRAWFVGLVLALLAAAVWFAVRVRVLRLLAVERARSRIASDLHDDVGSSVSRIGLLGELARRRLRDEPAAAEEILGQIGQEASELAEATSDIVWSIDPRRDDLGSLVVRLRRFAADLLEAKEIDLTFDAPADAAALTLRPEVRRALFLTLKEAVNNVAKHSGAAEARVRIELAGSELLAEVVDDGRGIDPTRAEEAAAEGRHGLGGMISRAAGAGGSARIEPAAGGGTRVELRFPAGRSARSGSHEDAVRGRRPG